MHLAAKIKSVLGLKAKPESKTVTLTECVQCGTPLEPLLTAAVTGQHRCGCGSMYKVISGCADVSQLRSLGFDSQAIIANSPSMKIKFGTQKPSE